MATNVDTNKIVDQVKNILLKPKETLAEVKSERPDMKDLIVYLAIVGLPTLIGVIIGYGVIGIGGFGYHIRVPIGSAFGVGILQYILSIVGIVIFGYIVNALAPTFSSKQDQIQAMKLVAYGATPAFVAGILYIIPTLGILVFLAGLYGLYIMYLGIPVLMETPEDKKLGYFIVSIVVYIVVMVVVNSVTGAVMGGITGYGVYGL